MKNNRRILYVEDNDFIREEAVEYLSLIYTNVLEASNGEEALEIYKESNPDIIITDIEMPIISGLQLVKFIRQENKKIPIIIVTAFTDTEYLLEAVELQLVKYIIKPMTNNKLDIALSLAHECLEKDVEKCVVQLSSHAVYDKLNRTLIIDKKVIELTRNERLLFNLLIQTSNRTITYSEIKNQIWSYEEEYINSLRSLIRSLRQKLNREAKIKNISGLGYKLIFEEY